MKVRQKNYQTDTINQTTESDESILDRLNNQIGMVTDQLMIEGLAQNDEEARVLLTNALFTPTVTNNIVRIARHRIQEGHVGFGYPEGSELYENVNFETPQKKKPFYRLTARRDIYDPKESDPIKAGDEIFTYHPENYPDADFECDRWSTKAKIGEEMPPGGWPDEML